MRVWLGRSLLVGLSALIVFTLVLWFESRSRDAWVRVRLGGHTLQVSSIDGGRVIATWMDLVLDEPVISAGREPTGEYTRWIAAPQASVGELPGPGDIGIRNVTNHALGPMGAFAGEAYSDVSLSTSHFTITTTPATAPTTGPKASPPAGFRAFAGAMVNSFGPRAPSVLVGQRPTSRIYLGVMRTLTATGGDVAVMGVHSSPVSMYAVAAPHYLVAGAVALPLLVALALRLLRGRRQRRRRRAGLCPACGYDLRGNPSGPCPECGLASSPVSAQAALANSTTPFM